MIGRRCITPVNNSGEIFLAKLLGLTRIVNLMVQIFAGWLVMIVTTVIVFRAVGFAGAIWEDSIGGPPMGEAGAVALLVMIFGSSFSGYWVSVRFVVQSRTAAPASLNNSTNSECRS